MLSWVRSVIDHRRQAFEKEGKGDLGRARSVKGTRERRKEEGIPVLPSPLRAASRPNSLLLPFQTPATQAIHLKNPIIKNMRQDKE